MLEINVFFLQQQFRLDTRDLEALLQEKAFHLPGEVDEIGNCVLYFDLDLVCVELKLLKWFFQYLAAYLPLSEPLDDSSFVKQCMQFMKLSSNLSIKEFVGLAVNVGSILISLCSSTTN